MRRPRSYFAARIPSRAARALRFYGAAAAFVWLSFGCSAAPADTGSTAQDAAADVAGDASAQDGGQDSGQTADATTASDSAAQLDASDVAPTDAGHTDAGHTDAAQTDAEHPDAGQVDAGPQDVFALELGLPVKAIIDNVSAGPWTYAAPVHGDVTLALDGKAQVKLVGPLDGQLDAVVGGAKQPSAVVHHAGMTYLADADGLRGILNGKLKLSPLAAFLPKTPITAMRAWKTGAGVDLWLVSGSALLLYRDSQLFTITAPKLDATGAHLSYGGDVEGGPALWVGGPAGLHALRVEQGNVTAWPYLIGRAVDGVHVDAKGRVWAASKGELLRRDAPGAWTTHVPKDAPTHLWGRPGDSAFWVRTNKALLRWDAEELHVVQSAPAVANWRLDDAGRLTGLDAKGALVRVQTSAPPAKPKVTWKTDIAPLFEKSCAQCHGVDGVNTKLQTHILWQSYYDKILKNVTSGAMPLPPKQPLTSGEIALIQTWKKDGFKETP